MFDVVTIGSALQDIFGEVARGEILNQNKSSEGKKYLGFLADSKIPIEKMQRHLGGGGINTAVVFNKLGLKPVPVSKVGTDSWGEGIVKQIRNYGIDISQIERDHENPTGLSFVLHDLAVGEHLSFNFKGASDNLDLGERRPPASKWLYVTSLTGDNWRNDMAAVVDLAEDIPVTWNPGSLQIGAISDLDAMLGSTEVLIVNQNEAEQILQQEGLDTTSDMRLILRSLSELGPRHVVVTEGSSGANFYADGTWYHAPIFEFDFVDATGTGDTFGATLTAGLIMEKDFRETLAMAIVNSAAVTRAFGAQQGLMSLDEVKRHINEVQIQEL